MTSSRIFVLWLCVLVIGIVSGCTKSPINTDLTVVDVSKEALQYNDSIIAIHSEVVDAYNMYINSLGSWATNITQIKTYLSGVLSAIDTADKKINLMSGFRWDTDFIDATKTYFAGIKNVVLNEETKFVDFVAQNLNLTGMDTTGTNLEQTIQTKLETIDQAYKKVQESFAKTYKFDLADTMLTWAVLTGA